MKKQPETLFKEKVISRLRTIKGLYFVKIQMVATRGIPDFLMCKSGQFIAWELKVKGNKPDQLQAFNLKRIEEAGGISRVVYPETFEEEFEFLQTLDSKKQKNSR